MFASDVRSSVSVEFSIGKREIQYDALDPETLKNEASWVPRIVRTMTLNYLPPCLQSQGELLKQALSDYAEFTDEQPQSHVSNGCYRQKMTLFVKKFKKIPKANFNLPCLVTSKTGEGNEIEVKFDAGEGAQYEIDISCTGKDDDPENPTPIEPNDPMCTYCYDKGHTIENCAAIKRRENQRFRLGASDNRQYFV